MRKRSLVLAFLLALTAVVPARASGAETVMTSEISLPSLDETPVIQVTVPKTGRIILNPYGLPTEIDGRTTTEQIASETMPIINNSDTPVLVSASAVGSVSELSSLTYAAQTPQADTREKEVFLYAEFQSEDGQWTGRFHNEENQILISEQASAPKEVLLLDSASEGMFRLFGAAAAAPEVPWSAEDVISVTFTFTFTAPDDSSVPESVTAEKPAEEPAGEPAEAPAEEPAGEPAEAPAEDPAGEPAEAPVEAPAGDPSESPGTAPDDGEPAEGELPETPPEEPGGESSEEPVLQPAPDPAFEDENQDSLPPDGEEYVGTYG